MTNSSKLLLLKAENERLMAENKKLKADLEFVAIMADIEIPEEERYESEN